MFCRFFLWIKVILDPLLVRNQLPNVERIMIKIIKTWWKKTHLELIATKEKSKMSKSVEKQQIKRFQKGSFFGGETVGGEVIFLEEITAPAETRWWTGVLTNNSMTINIWAKKKTPHFPGNTGCLCNRDPDPYNGFLWIGCHPLLYPKQPGALFSLLIPKSYIHVSSPPIFANLKKTLVGCFLPLICKICAGQIGSFPHVGAKIQKIVATTTWKK